VGLWIRGALPDCCTEVQQSRVPGSPVPYRSAARRCSRSRVPGSRLLTGCQPPNGPAIAPHVLGGVHTARMWYLPHSRRRWPPQDSRDVTTHPTPHTARALAGAGSSYAGCGLETKTKICTDCDRRQHRTEDGSTGSRNSRLRQPRESRESGAWLPRSSVPVQVTFSRA
jgi:hypothetical protein